MQTKFPVRFLHRPEKEIVSKSYLWIYLIGTDGLQGIVMYDCRPDGSEIIRSVFSKNTECCIHCDDYSAYGRLEDAMLVCCLAH